MNKRLKYLSLIMVSMFFIISCDKVDIAYKPQITNEIDESLFPGEWEDYLTDYYPYFDENTNTNVNVLIEDYTGHTCVNCPQAAEIAHGLQEAYLGRVFVASIHAGKGGMTSFQQAWPSGNKYRTDHTNPEGLAYGEEFKDGYGFDANPQGTVNRRTHGNKMFEFKEQWEERTLEIMAENSLKVNIQSQFNYFDETNGGFLHTEFVKETDDEINLNAVVYVLQDTLTDWQLMPDNSDNPDYLHRDKHLGSIDENPWGLSLFSADAKKGDKVRLDYSYRIPEDMVKSNLHFLIYAYDVDTYEIYQVIRQDIE